MSNFNDLYDHVAADRSRAMQLLGIQDIRRKAVAELLAAGAYTEPDNIDDMTDAEREQHKAEAAYGLGRPHILEAAKMPVQDGDETYAIAVTATSERPNCIALCIQTKLEELYASGIVDRSANHRPRLFVVAANDRPDEDVQGLSTALDMLRVAYPDFHIELSERTPEQAMRAALAEDLRDALDACKINASKENFQRLAATMIAAPLFFPAQRPEGEAAPADGQQHLQFGKVRTDDGRTFFCAFTDRARLLQWRNMGSVELGVKDYAPLVLSSNDTGIIIDPGVGSGLALTREMLQTLKAQLEFFDQMRNTAAASTLTPTPWPRPPGTSPPLTSPRAATARSAAGSARRKSKPQHAERESDMRKTKIVCTIGPACDSEETLRAMMLAGMNVARLNFSHGTHAEHQVRIDRIKKLRAELDLPIAIMLDTKGPEYRIGTFADGKIELHSGDTFTFTTEPVTGNAERVSVSYAGLAQDLEPGNTVLVNDGLIALTVTATTDTDVICRVTAGGVLSDRKSMSFPNKVLKQTFLSEQDKSDLLFGIENDVDFVAASFVSRKQDLADLNAFLRANGGEDISVIAKIENQPGIDNIEEIFTECTGIMIARGDMGVEVPYEELPSIQKELIGKCRLLGKRVITATEMLESMTHNIRPTRAEIADVANAVYDGTSAIMLSGETAAGEHPVEALSAMARIAEYTEAHINYAKRFPKTQFEIHDTLDAISHATCGMAIDIGAKVITVCSITGRTARLISRFRGPTDIIGLTTNERAYRKLALSWGITPVMSEVYESTDVLFYHALQVSRKVMQLEKGDKVIITGGIINGRSGNTNTIKVEYA